MDPTMVSKLMDCMMDFVNANGVLSHESSRNQAVASVFCVQIWVVRFGGSIQLPQNRTPPPSLGKGVRRPVTFRSQKKLGCVHVYIVPKMMFWGKCVSQPAQKNSTFDHFYLKNI